MLKRGRQQIKNKSMDRVLCTLFQLQGTTKGTEPVRRNDLLLLAILEIGHIAVNQVSFYKFNLQKNLQILQCNRQNYF